MSATTEVLTRPVTRWAGGEIRWNHGAELVEDRACSYCWATFTAKRNNQAHCSPECSKRDSAWNAWVRETNTAATHGRPTSTDLGPQLPLGGASLATSVARFATDEALAIVSELFGVEVAA